MLWDSLRARMEEKETDNKECWADDYTDKRERGARRTKRESEAETKSHLERERKANIVDLSAQQPLR